MRLGIPSYVVLDCRQYGNYYHVENVGRNVSNLLDRPLDAMFCPHYHLLYAIMLPQ